MKRILAIACIALCACSHDKKAELIKSTEAYLKEQMKDPSSFQVIKSFIIDTTMMSRWLKDTYKKDTAKLAQAIEEKDTSLVALYKGYAEAHLKEVDSLKEDRIFYITVSVDYNAKNSFGALGKETKFVNYYPADSTFKIW